MQRGHHKVVHRLRGLLETATGGFSFFDREIPPQIQSGSLPAGRVVLRYHQRADKAAKKRTHGHIARAAGEPMSDRLEFDIVCPNNHNQTVTFSQGEFEEALKSGALVFHCNTCDTDWTPTSDEIAGLRKQFAHEP
jgi:hypothetical protein